jgi:cytosine/adenosine deaminase-related metal-dependent hydrolase
MTSDSTEKEIAERVQQACIEAARSGFTDASISGLCTEGAMEAAISAIQMLDLEKILEKSTQKS